MKKHIGKILIAGGSGLVGSILKDSLEHKDFQVHFLTRSNSPDPQVHKWDPETEFIDENVTDHTFDALINLCGAGIADKRWSSHRKKVLYDSRNIPTQFLWSLIKKDRLKTNKFIQVSASGFYGNRPHSVNENDSPGSTNYFMVRLTKDWEQVFLENALEDVPHCRIRLGVVISSMGGFIDKFTTPLRFYVSPYFGDGQNHISWISEFDLAEMMHILIEKETLAPIYNFSTPIPVTSYQFSKSLIHVFKPKAISVPVPVWVIDLLFGEMKTAILADVQMMPVVFQNMGYVFHTPDIEDALRKIKTTL